MKPILHAAPVNGPFQDPVLYLDFMFEKRALLFDCGNLRSLPPRKLLRVTDLFVSHTHMDHFGDLDWLLRLLLGREKRLRLYGPEGFLERVESKLRAYSWNVAHRYDSELTLVVRELHGDGTLVSAEFALTEGFAQRPLDPDPSPDGLLLEDDSIRVRAAVLDHDIPCLGFAVQERVHVNIWKNRVEELGLVPGPWLRDLRTAIQAGRPPETTIRVPHEDGSEEPHPLGELAGDVARLVPGQKISYVVDARYHEENRRRIVDLARDADLFFIEAAFLDEDREQAARKNHLTARQAGTLAREAGVREVRPIHFSPRYEDGEEVLREEALVAFRGEGVPSRVSGGA